MTYNRAVIFLSAGQGGRKFAMDTLRNCYHQSSIIQILIYVLNFNILFHKFNNIIPGDFFTRVVAPVIKHAIFVNQLLQARSTQAGQ